MTGTIRSLSPAAAAGSIQSEDGLNFRFEFSAVLQYDVGSLSVGQKVTFDLEHSHPLHAVNVCIGMVHPTSPAEKALQRTIGLRYMGFDQTNSLRVYKFETFLHGPERRTFTVTADLGLFAKHHVTIQEGPSLCLHLLTTELEAISPLENANSQWSLTDKHLLAHLTSRTVSKPAPRAKHAPRDPAFSHLV